MRVGLVGSAAHGVLTGIAGPFGERFPGVSLIPREMNSLPQVEALRAGRLDVGFLYLPPDRGPGDLEAEAFAKEPLVAALSASHPLADARRVRLEAMSEEPFQLVKGVLDLARRAGTCAPRVTGAFVPGRRTSGYFLDAAMTSLLR